MTETALRLTELSHGGGCGCKIAPAVLNEMLARMPAAKPFANLLVGTETTDDAAVWRLNDQQALIATTDFFMPIVDDPFDFGRIAATNALSDVYAMGGTPIMALAIVGMPINVLPVETIGRILEGGASVCAEAAATVIKEVSRQLGQLSEKTQQLSDIGKDISSLQDILRSPKLRGNMGELFLGDLLSQILPPEHYQLQYTFQDGGKVDAVIRLQAGLVPVDAKFPLENFQRLVKTEAPEEKKALRRAFLQDVKKHVDAIATKYIRTDEGTFDFALMYIPAENVYYETIIKDDELGADGALFSYALARRVIPVSPNSFYAYLQTILLGLKGLRVEESAREIINHLARLNQEFDRFSESFRLVGDHMENALKKYEEAQKRLLKVEGKMEQLDGLAKLELTPPAAAE